MDIVIKVEPLDNCQNASQEILSSLYYLNNGLNTYLETNIYEKAKQDIRTIISDCNFNIQNVINSVNNKGWDQQKATCLANLIEKNWSELIGAALNHYSSNYGETVTKMDWLVKFIFGTSELKTLKYPLLQLQLTTVNKVGQQNKLSYDINKDMLLKLINTLENISL